MGECLRGGSGMKVGFLLQFSVRIFLICGGIWQTALANNSSDYSRAYRPPVAESQRERVSRCRNVDIRDYATPEVVAYLSRPQNQGFKGDIGYCNIIAGSEIATYWAGEPVSASYHWAQYISDLRAIDKSWRMVESWFSGVGRIAYSGGTLRESAETALRASGYRLCSASAMRSTLDETILPLTEDRWALLGHLANALENRKNSNIFSDEFEKSKIWLYFPQQKKDSILEKVQASSATKVIDLLSELGAHACEGHWIEKPMRGNDFCLITRHRNTITAREMRDYLDHNFDRSSRPGPVGVMYPPFMTRKAAPWYPGWEALGAHVSTLIGRRYNANQDRCEYLLRDSFGSDCA
jgi:hypothetical protein